MFFYFDLERSMGNLMKIIGTVLLANAIRLPNLEGNPFTESGRRSICRIWEAIRLPNLGGIFFES